jgi:hypothetical protein
MKGNRFPPVWAEEPVRRLLNHYEGQSEEESVAEDEPAYGDSSQTFLLIPGAIVPKVPELLSKNRR